MSKLIFIVHASLLLLVHGSTSCTVNEDVTSTVINWLPAYFQSSAQQALIVTTMFNSGQAGGGTIVNSAPFNGFNSTTQQLLWSLTKTSGLSVGIGYQDYEFLYYYTDGAANLWYFDYNAPSSITRSSFNVNQVTGITVGAAIRTTTYNCTKRPWYVLATNAHGALVYTTPYGDAVSGALDITATQAFYKNGAMKGAVFVDTCLNPSCNLAPTLSDSLVVLNSQPSVVAYVMETVTGLMLGNSAGAPICISCYASTSSNAYIAESAQYIIDNKISAPTSQFVPSLGFSVTTKYFLNEYGVAVTVVSADYSTTTTNDDGNAGNTATESSQRTVIGLVSTVLAVTVLGLVFQLISYGADRKTPLSTQSGGTELASIKKPNV